MIDSEHGMKEPGSTNSGSWISGLTTSGSWISGFTTSGFTTLLTRSMECRIMKEPRGRSNYDIYYILYIAVAIVYCQPTYSKTSFQRPLIHGGPRISQTGALYERALDPDSDAIYSVLKIPRTIGQVPYNCFYDNMLSRNPVN